MKKTLALLLLLVFSTAFSQNLIIGKITDDDGAVPSASVTLEDPANSVIIAFAISDTNGNYKISYTSALPKLRIKVKAFNRKTESREINNASQSINFKIASEATEIKEVQLKTKLITKRGDTISYDLKAFESKSDRVLSDVLKKIPGIEVNKDGSILYQGEPINKFYVNGKDLMEGSYGTISNSLPKDAIQKVEVMENHQPVKILQDKIPSENAALNVKLKSSVTMTGRGEAGAGGKPALWNLKLTPMLFTPKLQWVLNYKANNTGESVENENQTLAFGNRFEGMRRSASQSTWTGVERASLPNIPEKRYLLNNVHFLSANVLSNLTKEWEVKANASYANNAVERESYERTVYPDAETDERRVVNDFYTNQGKGELILTKNAKKGFFKNTTTWNGFWNTHVAEAFKTDGGGNREANQRLYSPTGSFQNSLSTIIPVKEKLVNVMSYVNVKNDRQNLTSTPGSYSDRVAQGAGMFEGIEQTVDISSLDINHSASVGFTHKNWTFTPEAGLEISKNTLDTELFGFNGENVSSFGNAYANNSSWDQLKPYTQLGINFKKEGVNLMLNLPVNFYSINFNDEINPSSSKEITKTTMEPSLFASYDFASFWKLMVFGNMNYNLGSFGSLYTGYILDTPDSRIVRNSRLPEYRNQGAGTRVEYRNPLTNLFFNVRYNAGRNKSNLITSRYFDPENPDPARRNLVEIIDYDNTTTSQSQGAEVGKYFPKVKTNASLSFSNRNGESLSLYNGELLENKTSGQNAGFKFNNNYFDWMSVDYTLSMNWSKNQNAQTALVNRYSGWSHNLSAFFYPKENHTLGFYWDDISTKSEGNAFRNSFYDASYQYTWAKRKIDFELKLLNLANTDRFEQITRTAENIERTSSINIRPRQLMFTVKFNFK